VRVDAFGKETNEQITSQRSKTLVGVICPF
jgi:hypothetical protein